MFLLEIPPIISLSRRLISGGQEGCNADDMTNAAPPNEIDGGKCKKVPFQIDHKQVEASVETVPNQTPSNRNNGEKSLNEELLANDSLGG